MKSLKRPKLTAYVNLHINPSKVREELDKIRSSLDDTGFFNPIPFHSVEEQSLVTCGVQSEHYLQEVISVCLCLRNSLTVAGNCLGPSESGSLHNKSSFS